jgi:heat shock protein HtpX
MDFSNVFGTHPSVEARVEALVKYAGGHDPGPLAVEAPEPQAQIDDQSGGQSGDAGPWGDAPQSAPQAGPWGNTSQSAPQSGPWGPEAGPPTGPWGPKRN